MFAAIPFAFLGFMALENQNQPEETLYFALFGVFVVVIPFTLLLVKRKDLREYELKKVRQKYASIQLSSLEEKITRSELEDLLIDKKYIKIRDDIFSHKYVDNLGDGSLTNYYYVMVSECTSISEDLINKLLTKVNDFKKSFCTYVVAVIFIDYLDSDSENTVLQYIKRRVLEIHAHRFFKVAMGFSPVIVERQSGRIFYFDHKSLLTDYKHATRQITGLFKKKKPEK